jgi:hypothetical protein
MYFFLFILFIFFLYISKTYIQLGQQSQSNPHFIHKQEKAKTNTPTYTHTTQTYLALNASRSDRRTLSLTWSESSSILAGVVVEVVVEGDSGTFSSFLLEELSLRSSPFLLDPEAELP